MKAKKFLVILCLLAVALLAVACGEDETTTAEPVVTTTAEATTTAATTTKAATTTAATTTVAATTKATTKATTAATTTAAATTAAPAPVAPADPYLWNGNVATAFAGGTGTAEDPYQIANGAQLALMAETFEKGAYYILVDDIMLNDVYNWNEWGNGDFLKPLNPWTPIEGFNANFDGKGKTIYGLYGIPLFKTTRDATVINIGLAYTKVNGSVLIGTATDTNINGITLDDETTYLNGKLVVIPANATIDDIMDITGTKWLITLGANPEVWTFEGLAAGALATDLYVANDKLGTSFNVTIVDGKGYTEEEEPASNKALAWDANDANANTIVLNITKDATATFNWHFATEVIVYVDGSAQAGAYEFGISLIDAAGKTWTLAKDKSVSTLDGKAWKEFKATGATVALEDGYKGWVRIPFASFTDGENGAIDTLNNSIAQIALTYKNASATDEGTFYIDSVRLVYPEGQNAAPNTIPNFSPVYGITVLQDFNAAAADVAWIKSGQDANISAKIVDGKYVVNVTGSVADTYFGVNKKIPADAKGFLIHVDASEVVQSADSGSSKPNTPVKKTAKIGFRFQIDGKYWAHGATIYNEEPLHGKGKNNQNKLTQNIVYALCKDGGWAPVVNVNNTRTPLPEDGFTGWLYYPIENLSNITYPGLEGNINFLDEYLTKGNDNLLKQIEIYYADINKNSKLVIDSLCFVTGENVDITLPDAPATLPTGVKYDVTQSIDFENAGIFKVVENNNTTNLGNITADGGNKDSGAWSTTTADNNGTIKAHSTIQTSVGYNLQLSYNTEGMMMYINLSELTPLDGKDFVSLKIGLATAHFTTPRDDGAMATDGGNYWNFTLNKTGNLGGATGYIVDEDGKWAPVHNNSNNQYLDIPAGYEGYLYIPITEFCRSTKTTDNIIFSGQGVEAGYNFIRLIHTELLNVKNAGETAYVDSISLVDTPVYISDPVACDKAPAKLPENVEYDVAFKYGFECESEFISIDGDAKAYEFTSEGAVSGNAIKLSFKEVYCTVNQRQSMKDIKGVLFYASFDSTNGKWDCGEGGCVSITINNNNYRANGGTPEAYYLVDGTTEWVKTQPVNSCRMYVPTNFSGWVYIPIESYPADVLNTNLTVFRIYTNGYENTATPNVLIDELMFIK